MHILTIEDPIEFVHTNQSALVTQREIGSHSRRSRAALRAALREDPDVILLGELRDPGTVQLAIEASNTGHLVFGPCTPLRGHHRGPDRRLFEPSRQEQIRSSLAGASSVWSATLCRRAAADGSRRSRSWWSITRSRT